MSDSQILQNIVNLQIKAMQDSIIVYKNIIANISPKNSRLKLAKGGWSILEVVCHLSDYESIFLARLDVVVKHEKPNLPVRTSELEARAQSKYPDKNLARTFLQFEGSRKKSINYIKQINPSDLTRQGIHPVYGNLSLVELITRFSSHDINHLKQITNILKEHNEI